MTTMLEDIVSMRHYIDIVSMRHYIDIVSIRQRSHATVNEDFVACYVIQKQNI